MKKLIGLGAVCLALLGCTPTQVAWHVSHLTAIAQETDPAKKQELQSDYDQVVANYQATYDEATTGHPCEQWFDLAMEAGFTPEQWKEPVSRIMNRESGCNPSAQNSSSSAAGLMQELEMWLDDCGGTTHSDFYDPAFNLNCAYHIYTIQGWQAWATY